MAKHADLRAAGRQRFTEQKAAGVYDQRKREHFGQMREAGRASFQKKMGSDASYREAHGRGKSEWEAGRKAESEAAEQAKAMDQAKILMQRIKAFAAQGS
ncbi:MAG: hypothetical protein EBU84_21135 [Actinobacteria bacterium]|nr:hypothetical protein [Actinomycetota bacterium]